MKRHPHLDLSEINATVLLTDGPMLKPQQPHMGYSWETILLPSRNESKLNRMKYLHGVTQFLTLESFLLPLVCSEMDFLLDIDQRNGTVPM